MRKLWKNYFISFIAFVFIADLLDIGDTVAYFVFSLFFLAGVILGIRQIFFIKQRILGTSEFEEIVDTLGEVLQFNDVIQKFINTNEKIIFKARKRNLTLKEIGYEDYDKQSFIYKTCIYEDISLTVKDHLYTIDEIKRFEITHDESIKKSHELDNIMNGRSITSAMAYSRDLNESARLQICFSDGKCFILKKVNNNIANIIRSYFIQKDKSLS